MELSGTEDRGVAQWYSDLPSMFQPGSFLTPRTKKNKNKRERTARAIRGAISGISQSNQRLSSQFYFTKRLYMFAFPRHTWNDKW